RSLERRVAEPSRVELAARAHELRTLLLEPLGEGRALREAQLGGIRAHFLRDLHRAELRPAHRAEVRALRALGRQRLVVERARRVGVERQLELILPAELEARLR